MVLLGTLSEARPAKPPVITSEGTLDEKETIRNQLIGERDALSPEQVAADSAKVHERLEAIPLYRETPAILSYVEKGNEVRTRPIIARALERQQAVVIPLVSRENQESAPELQWSRLYSLEDLAPGPFGVPEPRHDRREPVIPPIHAVVLVPGVAFARNGHRLGYGAGYFDRFLVNHPGPSIGLAYDFQVLDRLPAEPRDVPVDVIVTPSTTLTITT